MYTRLWYWTNPLGYVCSDILLSWGSMAPSLTVSCKNHIFDLCWSVTICMFWYCLNGFRLSSLPLCSDSCMVHPGEAMSRAVCVCAPVSHTLFCWLIQYVTDAVWCLILERHLYYIVTCYYLRMNGQRPTSTKYRSILFIRHWIKLENGQTVRVIYFSVAGLQDFSPTLLAHMVMNI